MKLREILPNIDFLSYVIIKEYYGNDLEPEVHYKGTIFDIPWSFAEMELDTNEDGEAISVGLDKFREDEGDQPCFIIYVRDPA